MNYKIIFTCEKCRNWKNDFFKKEGREETRYSLVSGNWSNSKNPSSDKVVSIR
jgi:hypothetical protein